jgi:hypothetical protein
MLTRDEILLKLEESEREVKTWKKILQVLDRSKLLDQTGANMRFSRVRPQVAIKMVLNEKGPQTQEALMRALESGGIALGKKRGLHNSRISIEKTLRTGALQQFGDLIGLPEWSEDKFTKAG